MVKSQSKVLLCQLNQKVKESFDSSAQHCRNDDVAQRRFFWGSSRGLGGLARVLASSHGSSVAKIWSGMCTGSCAAMEPVLKEGFLFHPKDAREDKNGGLRRLTAAQRVLKPMEKSLRVDARTSLALADLRAVTVRCAQWWACCNPPNNTHQKVEGLGVWSTAEAFCASV